MYSLKHKRIGDYTEEEVLEMINNLSEPWDRLPVETDKQYRAFRQFFCRISRNDRTVLNAYDNYLIAEGKEPAGRANVSWYKWSKVFLWEERSYAYDLYREEELINYAKNEQYAQLIEFRRRQSDLAGMLTDTAATMIKKVMIALETLKPEDLSPAQIANYIKVAAQVAEIGQNAEAGALALNEIVDRLGIDGNESITIDVITGNKRLTGVAVDDDTNDNELFIDILNDFDSDDDEETV